MCHKEMLRNQLITNASEKTGASNSAKNLDDSSDVLTKIIASFNKEDQQQANEPHPLPHQKEIPVQ